MTQYIYKYLKTIPIKVSDIKEDQTLDIEKYLKKIQHEFPKEEFCSICAHKKKHDIKIKIVNFPKILILVFYGNAKFKIKNTIKHGEYELIAAEIRNKNILNDIMNFFGLKTSNYYKFVKKEMNKGIEDSLEEEIPIVLFYKKRGQMIIDNDSGDSSNDSFCTSNKSTENIEMVDIEINNRVNKNKNSNEIKEKNNNNEKKEKKEIKNITLFFKLSKDEKKYTIKVSNLQSFSKITEDLKKNNKDFDKKNINLHKIMFNNKQISMNKTPNDYQMDDENTIMILEE